MFPRCSRIRASEFRNQPVGGLAPTFLQSCAGQYRSNPRPNRGNFQVPLKLGDATIRFNYATALFNAGKFQDGASNYREAIRLNPSFDYAHYNLGMTLLRLNDPESAQAEFAEAHRLDPALDTPVTAK